MPNQIKIFRVFVSSTFTDMKVERMILQTKVFPALERLCESNGGKFQAVDLRWGINEESQMNHKTIDICLNEIARCQLISPKPNFITLLGDRYGWQPLPPKIPENELKQILKNINKEEKELIFKWYRLDKNSIPPEYILQSYDSKSLVQSWGEIEGKLRSLLRTAIGKLNFTAHQKIKYFSSATHQEIVLGAMDPPPDVNDSTEHVFAYIRKIKGLPSDKTAEGYLDLYGDTGDSYCKEQLTSLKQKLKEKLGKNYWEYDAKWEQGTIGIYDPEAFAAKIYQDLKGIIEKQLEEIINNDEIEQEIRINQRFLEKSIEHFCGRRDQLEAINHYLNDTKNNKVLSIVGLSGSGKSSLMAKSIEISMARKNTLLIYRFIGVSSSSINTILLGICSQLSQEFGIAFKKITGEEENLYEMEALTRIFPKCLALASETRPVLIYLDALDQISENTIDLNWLPEVLPPHTKVIISAVSELENDLKHTTIMHLPGLPMQEASEILNKWLQALQPHPRTLTSEQRKEVLHKFKQFSLPVYLKLSFEQVRQLHSYDRRIDLSADVAGIINQYFSMLEHEHTELLVSTVMAYIVSGKYNGLAEREILDLLVLNQKFWQGFLANSHPGHRQEVQDAAKLPMVVWSRLFLDLEPYLTERKTSGIPILTFFHRQFNQAVKTRYLNNKQSQIEITSLISDYFKQEPLFYEENLDRIHVRKCIELPYQQAMAEKWFDLAETLGDLLFIDAKVKIGLINDLIEDYRMSMTEVPDSASIKPYYTSLMLQQHHIRKYPDQTFQYMYENLWWKDGNIHTVIKNAHDLYIGKSGRLLKPLREPQIKKSSLMMTLTGHTNEINACVFSPDSKVVCSASEDNTLKLWNIKTGKEYMTLTGHMDQVSSCDYSNDGTRIVSGSWDKTAKIWDSLTGKLIRTLSGDEFSIMYCSYLNNDDRIITDSDNILRVWDSNTGKEILSMNKFKNVYFDGSSSAYAIMSRDGVYLALMKAIDEDFGLWSHSLTLYNILNGEIRVLLEERNRDVKFISCYAFSKDSRYLTAGIQNTLKLWDTKTCNELMIFSGNDTIHSCAFSPDGRFVLSGSVDLTLWDIQTGEKVKTFADQNDRIRTCSFSKDGMMIVSGRRDHTLKIWDTCHDQETAFTTGHDLGIRCCAFSPDGRSVVTGSNDSTLKLWDSRTGHELLTLTGHSDRIRSCAFSPDGSKIMSGGDDKGIRIWDITTKKNTVFEQTSIITCSAFSPDGCSMVCSNDDQLLLYDIKNRAVIAVLKGHEDSVECCAYSPDGRLLVSGSYDKTLKIWDVKRATELMTLKGHTSNVASCAFSPDGNRIVSGSYDNTIKVWDNLTGDLITTLIGHSNSVASCSFSGDSKLIVSSSFDNTVKIWDIKKELYTLHFDCEIFSVCFSPDGSTIACGDDAGNFYLYQLEGF